MAVIFDMDGTILHLGWEESAMATVRAELGRLFDSYGVHREFKPLLADLHAALRELEHLGLSWKEAASEAEKTITRAEVRAAKLAQARRGARTVIADLSRVCPVLLVTSNGRECVEAALWSSWIASSCFSAIVTRNDCNQTKPLPLPFQLALRSLPVDFSVIVCVGDRISDGLCARALSESDPRLRVISIGIAGGLSPALELFGSPHFDCVVHDLGSVEALVATELQAVA